MMALLDATLLAAVHYHTWWDDDSNSNGEINCDDVCCTLIWNDMLTYQAPRALRLLLLCMARSYRTVQVSLPWGSSSWTVWSTSLGLWCWKTAIWFWISIGCTAWVFFLSPDCPMLWPKWRNRSVGLLASAWACNLCQRCPVRNVQC